MPALNSTLAVGSKTLGGTAVTSDAGHGVSPLAFCAEASQNMVWSEAWITPRFGLAPPPVQADDGGDHC